MSSQNVFSSLKKDAVDFAEHHANFALQQFRDFVCAQNFSDDNDIEQLVLTHFTDFQQHSEKQLDAFTKAYARNVVAQVVCLESDESKKQFLEMYKQFSFDCDGVKDSTLVAAFEKKEDDLKKRLDDAAKEIRKLSDEVEKKNELLKMQQKDAEAAAKKAAAEIAVEVAAKKAAVEVAAKKAAAETTEIAQAADEIAQAADEISQAADEISQVADVADEISDVAEITDEIAQAADEITDEIAQAADEITDEITDEIAQAADEITKISVDATEISSITGLSSTTENASLEKVSASTTSSVPEIFATDASSDVSHSKPSDNTSQSLFGSVSEKEARITITLPPDTSSAADSLMGSATPSAVESLVNNSESASNLLKSANLETEEELKSSEFEEIEDDALFETEQLVVGEYVGSAETSASDSSNFTFGLVPKKEKSIMHVVNKVLDAWTLEDPNDTQSFEESKRNFAVQTN